VKFDPESQEDITRVSEYFATMVISADKVDRALTEKDATTLMLADVLDVICRLQDRVKALEEVLYNSQAPSVQSVWKIEN
jgi:hypothetical protein